MPSGLSSGEREVISTSGYDLVGPPARYAFSAKSDSAFDRSPKWMWVGNRCSGMTIRMGAGSPVLSMGDMASTWFPGSRRAIGICFSRSSPHP